MRKSINRETVRQLREAGAGVTEIAAELGCGKAAISKILKGMTATIVEPAPARITDPKLLYLLQVLYDHLWVLRKKGWNGAPKRMVRQRLKILAAVVKE